MVKLWDSQSGSQLKTIQGFGKEVTGVQYLGASETFWAVSGDQTLCRCDFGGARNGVNQGNDFLYSAATDQYGRAAVFAGHDSIVRVVDKDGKTFVEFPPAGN
ncbi:MAG: hypothetical protein R3C28_07720 [Pirellulaceae bacterium]